MTARKGRSLVDTALASASTTRDVVIRPGAIGEVGSFFRALWPGRTALIVADERTLNIAGRAVQRALDAAGIPVASPFVFPAVPTLRPDIARVVELRQCLGPSTVPIAVGSGTLNDLTKRAAFESGLPYMVVATAASMDGYTASGAALISDGVKQTFDCPAPAVVVADLTVIKDAPQAMTASGYGDLVGKVTAGADWILADALEIEPIMPDIWHMVQDPLRGMIDAPERYFTGDEAAVGPLFEGLVMTGLAIQAAGTTRPASGSEHQFSHLWEMRGLEHKGELVSHGMKVGLGTIVSTTIYNRLLARPIESLDIDRVVAAWPTMAEREALIRRTHDHPMLVEKALTECRAKDVSPDQLHHRLALLRDRWPTLREHLQAQLLPLDVLSGLLARAHCPIRPEDIGLTMAQMRASYLAAGHIRRRYTVFDIAAEIGLLDDFVDEIFAPRGPWDAGTGIGVAS